MTTSENRREALVEKIIATYEDRKGINHIDGLHLPDQSTILQVLNHLIELVFPGFYQKKCLHSKDVSAFVSGQIEATFQPLKDQICHALGYAERIEGSGEACNEDIAEEITIKFFEAIPAIRETLKTDVQAAFDGDPAAKSFEEIIISYPAIFAITTHRLAHFLYQANVPIIPRVMSECSHSKTGIDIHPGAQIGKSFFIDHGTGVVIGETCQIGEHVKIYQGVTLGALSIPKDSREAFGTKRHPTLEDEVTIYAGATILGGDTVIGEGAVIGGNVWLTKSVGSGAKITIGKPDLRHR